MARLSWLLIIIFLSISCTTSLVRTDPEILTDSGKITLTFDANSGNRGLMDFSGPVYVHLGLITDSSKYPNEWRYVRFKWGSVEKAALATPSGKNRWTYTIPNMRSFFGVAENEKIFQMGLLLREGNCIDTFCRVLRNADKTDIYIPVNQPAENK